jgi:hypothetical protein
VCVWACSQLGIALASPTLPPPLPLLVLLPPLLLLPPPDVHASRQLFTAVNCDEHALHWFWAMPFRQVSKALFCSMQAHVPLSRYALT